MKFKKVTSDFHMKESDYYWGVHSTLPDGSSELNFASGNVEIYVVGIDNKYGVVALFGGEGEYMIQNEFDTKDAALTMAEKIYNETLNYSETGLKNKDCIHQIANKLSMRFV